MILFLNRYLDVFPVSWPDWWSVDHLKFPAGNWIFLISANVRLIMMKQRVFHSGITHRELLLALTDNLKWKFSS
jgi:hypothetical protein